MTYPTKPREFRHASFCGSIGLARADITPPVGIFARNWGAAKHDVAQAIHRPLMLTALALSPAAGGTPLVLVDADLGGWSSPQVFSEFLSRLQKELSLEPANLIFALSHTHSAPLLMNAGNSLQGGDLHRAWMKELFQSTVRTLRQALESRFVGRIDWHAGRCGMAVNRDLRDPDPLHNRLVCGYNPDGNPDDTLLVGRITDMTGRLQATLVNYACHPTTLGWENAAISPDYVGAMRDTIQQATDSPALFLLGACGELAPRHQYIDRLDVADLHGRELGFAALSVLHSMEPPGAQLTYAEVVESGAPLAVWKHEPYEASRHLEARMTFVTMPLKVWPSAEEMEKQLQQCSDRVLKERLRRKLNIRFGLGNDSTFELPVHIWRIGDAVLVGSCCEAYSVLQQELRRQFPDTKIVCMNLINGSMGYLPPAELYDEEVYTVWQTPFDRGSFERLLETMVREVGNALAEGRVHHRLSPHIGSGSKSSAATRG